MQSTAAHGNPHRTRIRLHLTDPLALAGIRAALAGLDLLPDDRLAEAEVFLVHSPALTPDVMAALRRAHRAGTPRSVLVADRLDGADLLAAVEYGLLAVVARAEATPRRLREVVLAASRGVPTLTTAFVGGLLAELRRVHAHLLKPRGLGGSGLAADEVGVLRLLAEGADTEEIAAALGCSVRTVSGVVQSTIRRLGLNSRSHAVAYAFRAGVL